MKTQVIAISVIIAISITILVQLWRGEQHSLQEGHTELMQSPLTTGLTPVTEPESGGRYYSVKYRTSRQGGYEVFEVGNLRLIRKADSKSSFSRANGSLILPGDKKLPNLEPMYAKRIKIFGKKFRIEGDELLLGNARLKMISPEPRRLEIDSDWNPVTGIHSKP